MHSVQIDESVLGWKEYELEVVRDSKDNCIIVCSIENLDPMGVHTGDSITVAPAQTLTDKEYERMRDASLAIIREIGVDTGGSNVQFGVNPKDGRMVVIEMNPRVSRSSALASKATGYPIAKIAAKLAIGYTLDELKNDITRDTPASFEPTIDYVVVKIPKFNFEKFPKSPRTLGTMMRSVGEVMAIGRTFRESYLKAFRSLEQGRLPIPTRAEAMKRTAAEREELLRVPTPERPWVVLEALPGRHDGGPAARLHRDGPLVPPAVRGAGEGAQRGGGEGLAREDERLRAQAAYKVARLLRRPAGPGAQRHRAAVREERWKRNIRPVYKRVDTCAAEFEAFTPYLYSTYEEEDEAPPTDRKKIVILGSGPIRIGQGIEFDYCCVHAAFALREAGFETIMVNCNPETVSTDYDTSDRLYFEPLTMEDVLEIIHREKPLGVIVQFGGQTPLKLSKPLEAAGVPILGTTPDAIDQAEDRERFSRAGGPAAPAPARERHRPLARGGATAAAEHIGYPVMVRPSLRAGRPGDGGRLRPGRPRALHARGGAAPRPSTRC